MSIKNSFPFNSIDPDKLFRLRTSLKNPYDKDSTKGYYPTRNKLAMLLGLTKTTINAIEAGTRINPSFHTIIQYCRFFNISPYELMGSEVGTELLDNYLAKLIKEGVISAEAASKIKEHHIKKK